MTRELCPECKGNIFDYDENHDELSCRQCGLILEAPVCYGLVFPGFCRFPSKKKFDVQIFSKKYKIVKRYQITYDLR